MTFLRDYLEWYNNQDVGPFVQAVRKLQSFYFERNIDIFKVAMSVKTSIVSAPSIIFNRYAKTGENLILNNPEKPCQNIIGYDANALYLWALDESMPTGPYIRRRADTGFREEVRDKYMSAYYWMEWITSESGKQIQHELNLGRKKRVGPFPVDGYFAETNTIFHFMDVFFTDMTVY